MEKKSDKLVLNQTKQGFFFIIETVWDSLMQDAVEALGSERT